MRARTDMDTQREEAILAAGASTGGDFKLAVITGASRGLGLEFTRQLLQAGGYRVVATCRQPEAAHELQELASLPGMVGPITLDVTDGETISKAVEAVSAQATAVHLLINNAGVANVKDPQDHVLNTTPECFNELFDVNCTGVLRCTHAFLPLLRAGRGTVVNITDVLGSLSKADTISPGFFAAYRCSKAAANMLTRTLAAGEPQVTFLALQPGVVATELGKACRSTIAGLPPHVVEGMPIEETVKEMIAVIQQAKQTGCTGLSVDGEPFPW